MMNSQPMPVPVTLDTREPLLIDKKSSPNLTGLRSSQGSLLTGPGTRLYDTLPTADSIRNLNYMFLDNPVISPYDEGLLILTPSKAYFRSETGPTLYDLGESYAVPMGFARHPRFAVVNSRGLAAWTLVDDFHNYSVRVRTMTPARVITPIPQDYAGRYMIAFNERLLIASTKESTASHLARLRWCVNGNFQDWTGIGAGFLDVPNVYPGRPIQGLMALGNKAYLSLHREIQEIIPTGNPSPAFTLETRILGSGIYEAQTWAATEYFGFFLGIDSNVYRWDGANLTSISRPIAAKLAPLLTPTALITPHPQAAINLRDEEYWLLPDHGTLVFIYDYREDRWFTDTYPVEIRSLGEVYRTSVSKRVDQAKAVLGDANSVITQTSKTTTQYDGSPMTRYVETPDYSAQEIRSGQLLPSLHWRNSCYGLRFRWIGSSPVEVGYSIDKGATWVTQSVTVDATDGVATVFFIVDFNRIRFRFVTTETFGLSDILEFDWERGGAQL